MLSVFGKLLCKELGEQKYDKYFVYYSLYVNSISQKDAGNESSKQNEIIFVDIYNQLKEKDIYLLHGMLERLLSAIELSIRITRQYIWVLLASIITIGLLWFCPVYEFISLIGIATVIISLGYKSVVFVVNRYCFIDANIMLLYKTALFHIIIIRNMEQ